MNSLMNKTKSQLIAMIESMYTEEQKTEAYDQGFDFGKECDTEGETKVDSDEYTSLLKDSENLDIIRDILYEIENTKAKLNLVSDDLQIRNYTRDLNDLYEKLEGSDL